jgi:glycosyltransferase involved in cell wall biosynthesis
VSRHLLVFADDWGRHPSSCQHLVRRLLDHYEVTWVNSIGTRPPRLNLSTMRRAMEKLRHWSWATDGCVKLPDNLIVMNPKMWPWFSSRFDRWVNRVLLCRQLGRHLRQQAGTTLAITTLPIVADLMGQVPVAKWIYYCVDDFSEWPGLDGKALQRLEEVVIRKADSIIAVSETLQDRIARRGRRAHLLTHGVDLEFWCGRAAAPISALDKLERPFVVFWGVIDRRLDITWVKALSAQLERGTLIFCGPVSDPDPSLHNVKRCSFLGPLAFEVLPTLAKEASVLVMPYADLPVTRAIQPLKLKEYLATGKPVVIRDLPATRPWADCADVVKTCEEFCARVMQRLAGLPAGQQESRRRLEKESWDAKARQFEQWALAEESAFAAC